MSVELTSVRCYKRWPRLRRKALKLTIMKRMMRASRRCLRKALATPKAFKLSRTSKIKRKSAKRERTRRMLTKRSNRVRITTASVKRTRS